MTIPPPGRRRALGLATAALAGTAVPALARADTTLETIQKRGVIRVAIADEVPYGYLDENGQAAGIGPSVARHVLAAIGIKHIRWVVIPFGELIPGLHAGRVDMVAAEQNILPARCQVVEFSVPDSSYGEGLLVRAGNPENIHSYVDIKNNSKLKLAIVAGADELAVAHAVGIPDSQLVMLNSNADALSSVRSGRVAAYGATELTIARFAKLSRAVEAASPFAQPVVHGKQMRGYGAFSFRKREVSLFNAFNAALTSFKTTNAWARIMSDAGLGPASIQAARNMTTAQLCAI